MLASQGIATGDRTVSVAGGMESMSNTPYITHFLTINIRTRLKPSLLTDTPFHEMQASETRLRWI